MSQLTSSDIVRIFFRSLYLQAALNYQRMQGLGFAAALMPVIDKVCRTKEEKISFLRRHLEFFNAHPYFASFALGITVRLEEAGGEEERNEVRLMKKAMSGPLGSLGDQLFWGSLLPAAGVIGAVVSLRGIRWGPVLFLLLYNIPHLWIRWRGLKRGYELGRDVSRELSRKLYARAKEGVRLVGAIMVGLYLGSEAGRLAHIRINYLVPFSLCIIFSWIALRKHLPLYVLIPLVVIAGALGTVLTHGFMM